MNFLKELKGFPRLMNTWNNFFRPMELAELPQNEITAAVHVPHEQAGREWRPNIRDLVESFKFGITFLTFIFMLLTFMFLLIFIANFWAANNKSGPCLCPSENLPHIIDLKSPRGVGLGYCFIKIPPCHGLCQPTQPWSMWRNFTIYAPQTTQFFHVTAVDDKFSISTRVPSARIIRAETRNCNISLSIVSWSAASWTLYVGFNTQDSQNSQIPMEECKT